MAGDSKFISSLQKIVLLNILIAFIFTILLLIENRPEIIQDWGLASVIFYLRVYYNVIATGRAGVALNFESSSPLQNGVPPLLFFSSFCHPELRAALETWSRGRSSIER